MNIARLVQTLSLICLASGLQACVAAAGGAVATGAAVAFDRRSTGTIVDDQSIEIKSKHAISRNQSLWKQSRINTISYNNVLLLVGQTPSEAMKKEAETAVSDIARVRRIHNEIIVAKPASLNVRAQDAWITAQIKAKLLSSNRVNPARIKVTTENGIVYLMGLISPEEQAITTDIARNMEGVEKVIQIFERI